MLTAILKPVLKATQGLAAKKKTFNYYDLKTGLFTVHSDLYVLYLLTLRKIYFVPCAHTAGTSLGHLYQLRSEMDVTQDYVAQDYEKEGVVRPFLFKYYTR